jgi:preprotein translocase subunit SecD
MITGRARFNIYFLLAAALALLPGCKSKPEDSVHATVRVHLEVVPTSMDYSARVPIYRAKPVMVTVDKAAFLTEENVSEASVEDVLGGFNLRIKFDRQGTWLLESYTTANPGRHYAIFCAFGDKLLTQSRWLAAPVITRRISDGTITFTPDATRKEAEQIALGLRNAAKKNKDESKW